MNCVWPSSSLLSCGQPLLLPLFKTGTIRTNNGAGVIHPTTAEGRFGGVALIRAMCTGLLGCLQLPSAWAGRCYFQTSAFWPLRLCLLHSKCNSKRLYILNLGFFKSLPSHFQHLSPLSHPFSEGRGDTPPPSRGLFSTRLNWQGNSPPPPKESSRLGQPPGADKPA